MSDATRGPADLPDVFSAPDPAADPGSPLGAGRLVDSVRDADHASALTGAPPAEGDAEADEASEESFPGSDAPTYSGGTPTG